MGIFTPELLRECAQECTFLERERQLDELRFVPSLVLRWEIDIDNKVDRAGAHINRITAQRSVSVRVLTLASLINATLARIIVQRKKAALHCIRRNQRANWYVGTAATATASSSDGQDDAYLRAACVRARSRASSKPIGIGPLA
jgi:hypothetical protein